MKRTKKLMHAGLLVLLAVLLWVPAAKTQAKALKLNRTKLTMTVGQKKTLRVKNTKKKVTWKSTKPKVVKVSKKGVLTAKKAGKATVKAKVGKKTLKCVVTVKKKRAEDGKKKDDTQKKDEVQEPVDYSNQESGECRIKGEIYYIRTDGYNETVKYPRGTLICSREELQAYYQENRQYYSMAGSFKKTIDSFDDTYFKKNQLAVLLLETGSGSNSYRVVKGYYDADKKEYQALVELLTPGEGMAGTCDMAQWHILIPITDKIPAESTVTVTVELEPEENRFEKTMQAAKLDDNGETTRSFTEYEGIETLTNDFKAREAVQEEACDYTGMREFSYQLFGQTLKDAENRGRKNPVVSPVSAYYALSMAAVGAGEETEAEFTRILGSPESGMLCRQLKRHLSDTKGSTELFLANAVWLNEEFPVSGEYLQKVVNLFDAEAYSGKIDSDEMKNAVNQWVSEKTRGMIPYILENKFGERTAMALTNATYMNAEWEMKFSANSTHQGTFYKEDGSEIKTDFMYDKRILDYVETEEAEGAVLAYNDGKTVFLALRPNDGSSARELAEKLDASAVRNYIANARPVMFHFYMPVLETGYDIDMNEMLKNIGLKEAFTDAAEFGKMTEPDYGGFPLKIGQVKQKVQVKVNEKGTEAAAVTIVELEYGASPYHYPEVIRTLKLDSPYVYVIVDLPTQTPLFMGVVDEPCQKKQM